jgi:hypothetical protein
MKNNKIKSIVFCATLLLGCTALAQPSDQDVSNSLEETATDEAAAPIDNYLISLLLVGVIGGCYFLRKKRV